MIGGGTGPGSLGPGVAGSIEAPTGVDEAALVAVIAHGLMGNVALVRATAGLLREGYQQMSPDEREEAWSLLTGQADHIGAVLLDLVRQLPPESVAAMERAIRDERL